MVKQIVREQAVIHTTNRQYWDTIGNEYLNAIILPNYGAFISEEKLKLFGDVTNKKLLEIGCGNGQSLHYHAQRHAAELWGIDISANQLEIAAKQLQSETMPVTLLCSPMEADCDIPQHYFDYVYSIYSIGWTTDLDGTFEKVASYLKQDGVFIFSWSHPTHRCITEEEGKFVFSKSYFDESWLPVELEEGELLLANRKISTYINAIAKAGFMIEQVVEETDEEMLSLASANNVLAKRSKLFPVSFVIKARKL